MSTLSRSFLLIKSMAGRLIIVYRVFVFVAIVLLIHIQHRQWQIEMLIAERDLSRLLPLVQDVFPDAASITPASPAEKADSGLETMGNLLAIENRDGELSGYAVRTSPAADHIIGFSGPTDVLVTADTRGRIRKVKILSSLDTRDHVQEILDNQYFLPAFGSHSLQDMRRAPQVDAVSGATLTSLAILESLRFALNEDRSSENSPDGKLTHRSEVSLKFPEPPQLKDVQIIFPEANSVSASNQSGPGKWIVTNASGIMLGHIFCTSPAADNLIGYQGPTNTLIGLTTDDNVVGIAVGNSYDNEPYVDYVRDDTYFRKLFVGRSISELSQLDLDTERIEGVSGATMTSLAVAESLQVAAVDYVRRLEETQETASGSKSENPVYSFVTLRNISTTLITAIGVLIGTTGLRGKRRLRWSFQIILIVWLGLVNGDLLSQASLLGWSQNGIPWQRAAGLVILTLAAVIVPIVSRRNVYCSHICPHGAVQQLLRNRLPWKLSISGKIQRRLRLIPVILITWVMLVGFLHLPFSPVDIEPFDAWLFSIAGTATIIVAIGGLVASALTPMAYCRFGCPTGALLDFLTRSRRSDWQLQDTFALILLAAAIVLQMTV